MSAECHIILFKESNLHLRNSSVSVHTKFEDLLNRNLQHAVPCHGPLLPVSFGLISTNNPSISGDFLTFPLTRTTFVYAESAQNDVCHRIECMISPHPVISQHARIPRQLDLTSLNDHEWVSLID